MKAPDITSTLIAGAIGAVALAIIMEIVATMPDDTREKIGSGVAAMLAAGFLVGVGVQVGVRVTGVS